MKPGVRVRGIHTSKDEINGSEKGEQIASHRFIGLALAFPLKANDWIQFVLAQLL